MSDGKNNEYPKAEFAKFANAVSQTNIDLLHQIHLKALKISLVPYPTPELLLN